MLFSSFLKFLCFYFFVKTVGSFGDHNFDSSLHINGILLRTPEFCVRTVLFSAVVHKIWICCRNLAGDGSSVCSSIPIC